MKNILDDILIFSSLSDDDRQHLSYFCQKRVLERGEVLFHQWDIPESFYIVLQGSFLVERDNQEIWKVFIDEIIGEMALFGDNKQRNATVISIGESEVLEILDFSITELANNNPKLLEKIKNIIKNRLNTL